MKKIKLYMKNKDYTEDIFEFNTLEELFQFINQLTAEKLMDKNYTELEYSILVKE
jgi:hypothetical protein